MLGHRQADEHEYNYRDDSWWELERGDGWYYIKSVPYTRKLFYNASRQEVGAYLGPDYSDQHWTLKPSADKRSFQLIADDCKLYLRNHLKPYIGWYLN